MIYGRGPDLRGGGRDKVRLNECGDIIAALPCARHASSSGTLHWSGIRSDGVGTGGVVSGVSAADLAQQLYGRRLRWARITTTEGDLVGEVGPSRDDPRLTWWGEQ